MDIIKLPYDELARSYTEPAVGTPLTPRACYQLAFQAALQGAGRVRQNPLVGAVLVDAQRRFVAAGWHAFFGGPHAEVALMARIGEQGLSSALAGSTLYCTLEPCCYAGKTPACTDLLMPLPISRVVIAARDPNPRVQGKGIAALQASGKQVQMSAAFARCTGDLLAAFRCVLDQQRPYFAAKIAASVDGVIGRVGARRQWLSNERVRHYTHWLRQLYDGIMVGADTVINDNPALDAALYPQQRGKIPCKLVLDPQGRALRARSWRELAMLAVSPREVLWFLSSKALAALTREERESAAAHGVELVVLPVGTHGQFDVMSLAQLLWQRGLGSVLLEGGAKLWAGWISAGLLDKVYLVQVPQLHGLVGNNCWSKYLKLSEAIQLHQPQLTVFDDNWLLEASLGYGPTPRH